MPSVKASVAALTALLLISGCTAPPMGPTVAVMPAPGKPFDAFQADQAMCKQYADGQVAGQAEQANNQQVLTGVAGTLLGAGLGAAIGGGRGAAIGAGAGALGGSAMAAGQGNRAQYSLQQRYDNAYMQCMYARGNQIPGYAPAASAYPPSGYAPQGYAPQPGYPPQPYR